MYACASSPEPAGFLAGFSEEAARVIKDRAARTAFSLKPARDERFAETLYAKHWGFVFQLLPGYGVWGPDQEDVAQTVWQNVHAQIASYDPKRQSLRAWITGFVRRCAANYRRTLKRNPENPIADPAASAIAPGLNPEQYALLRTLEQAVTHEEQREAFVLRTMHGLTIEEIAAAMELSESQVEWKLQQARELLEAGEP